MLNKRSIIFLALFIFTLLLLTSCFLQPQSTEGLLKGQVLVPEGALKHKDLTGEALPNATVKIIDLSTGEVVATTTTDADGNYQVYVPPGGPYLLEAASNGVKVQQITCAVEAGVEYNLGSADCVTTTTALIVQAMLDEGMDLFSIDCEAISQGEHFTQVMTMVCNVIKKGEDPTTSSTVEQAVQDFLNPSPPPPLTYTVTYKGNGNSDGTVLTDNNTYQSGDEVTVLDKGNLEKIQDNIVYLFTGWNTASDGNGTSYAVADTFNVGSSNITLYAQWSLFGGTGPAGGLVFYDKGSVSDGWRYLEAAPENQDNSQIWSNITNTAVGICAQGTAIGTGKTNTLAIIHQEGHTDSAAFECADLSIENDAITYNDWFLPSKDELNALHANLYLDDLGNLTTGVTYWASSEFAANAAWKQYFNNADVANGSQSSVGKMFSNRVRAIRAFRTSQPTYIVSYHANGATGGSVPSDPYHYEPLESVTAVGNTGSLVNNDSTFDGWNTKADGSGTNQTVGSTFDMGVDNVILYAKWSTTINIAAIPGVTAPVTGATPVSTITETAQYTGTVTWNPNHGAFAGSTAYTVTITLTPKAGYTLTGVSANFFTVSGATTVTNSADSGVVTAVFPETATVAVGDSCGGGKVAYILQTGDPGYVAGEQHGLIAATKDQATDKVAWSNITSPLVGTGTAIGTGKQNTTAIINQNGCDAGAAFICYTLEEGGYDDWYLPSKDELGKLYYNASTVGGFETAWYWSSSESSASEAYLCRILYSSTPEFPTAWKGNSFGNHVRAVRSF